MLKRARPLAYVSVTWLGLVTSSSVLAHPGHKTSERLLNLDLSTTPARLKYMLLFTPSDADAVRSHADQNADGQLSADEQVREQAALTQHLASQLTLCHGPTLADTVCATPAPEHISLSDAENWTKPGQSMGITWTVVLTLAERDSAVRVRDAWLRDTETATAAMIVTDIERPAVSAGIAGVDDESPVELELIWPRETSESAPRELFVAWQAPQPHTTLIATIVTFLVALGAGLAIVWRRRQVADS